MVSEATLAFAKARLDWKPSSLLTLAAGSARGSSFSLTAPCLPDPLPYKQVVQLECLGVLIDDSGSTDCSVGHRLGLGDAAYYKHKPALRGRGGIRERLEGWASAPQASAVFGSESWHLTSGLLHRLRTWELQHLRRMLRLRPAPTEGPGACNIRSAMQIDRWFRLTGVQPIHCRVLRMVFLHARRELDCRFPGGATPLKWAREFRSALDWELAQCFGEKARRQAQYVHSTSGHRTAWEDALVAAYGPDWRSHRAHFDRGRWKHECAHFIDCMCQLWSLPSARGVVEK
eukprot:632796-Pyramimonas_sp.AAC.1